MSVSNADTRKLSFPLQNPETVVGDTPDDGTPLIPFSWQTTDSQEKVIVTLELSLDEYVALASAIDVGRDIAYGSDTNLLWWIWTRSINPMSFCARVIECIQSDPDVASALMQFLSENGYGTGAGTPEAPSILIDNPPLADGTQIPSCDNDNLFGGITQLVDLMHDMLVDAFEGFEAATGRTERIAAVLSAIPIVDVLPIDDLIEFADQLLENLSQDFDAQYTAEIRDEYRCDLFCATKDTCELDFQTWANYFASRAGATFDNVSITDALDWFLFGTFTGDLVVHAAHAIMCQILAYASDFFDINMSWITKAVTAFMNDPDPDWNVLCECGNAWCQVFDFDLSNGGWVSGTRAAGWTATYSDPYWTKSGNPQLTFEFQIAIPIGTILTGISVNNAMLRTSGVDTSPGWVWLDHNVATNVEIWRQNSNANTHAQQDYSNQTLNYTIAKGNLSLAVNVAGGAHEYRVYSVTLRGTGDNPFGESNCV